MKFGFFQGAPSKSRMLRDFTCASYRRLCVFDLRGHVLSTALRRPPRG